jgi:hypothetical protein
MSAAYYIREARKRQPPSDYIRIDSPAEDGCFVEHDIIKPILQTFMCSECSDLMRPTSIADRKEVMTYSIICALDPDAPSCCNICQRPDDYKICLPCHKELAADCARAIFCGLVARELVGQDIAGRILEWLIVA